MTPRPRQRTPEGFDSGWVYFHTYEMSKSDLYVNVEHTRIVKVNNAIVIQRCSVGDFQSDLPNGYQGYERWLARGVPNE